MKTFKDLDLRLNADGKIFQGGNNLEKVKSALDEVSSSLCLAKFTQVTMHLGSGHIHSCHHPKTHKIPLEELEKDPAALFNTSHLKEARAQMLNNIRPPECDYCWRVEDNGETSDRYFKSNDDWAIREYDNVVNSAGCEIFKPTYLEVSFGNACNLKCVYCGPEFSTQWVDEIRRHGPIKITDGHGGEEWAQGWQDLDSLSIPNREFNPYIDAFWKWFPEIYPTLKTYRITGGEPILNKNTFKSLDYVLANPKNNLDISINSNLSVPENLWQKFLNKIHELKDNAGFDNIQVYTSVESWGQRAEYARTGLEFELLQSRVEELLETTSVRCIIMATYNVLAITSFKELLEWTLDLKKKHNFKEKGSKWYRVGIDVPYLRHPTYLDAQFCNDELLNNYMIPCLEFMTTNKTIYGHESQHTGFEQYEIEKFQRIVKNRMSYNDQTVISKNKAKFYDFVNEIDQRRSLDFAATFPEMIDFYEECQQEKLKIFQSTIPTRNIHND